MALLHPEQLGNAQFKADYHLRYAYLAGAMYKGIASPELVIRMGKAKLLSFLGTGGLQLNRIETYIDKIQRELKSGEPYGMNLLCNINRPEIEQQTVDLFLAKRITCIEAAAYVNITAALVHFRLKGIHQLENGDIIVPNNIIAKISRPEIALLFMSPPPAALVDELVLAKKLSVIEGQLSQHIPLACDICIEADSGGHTDQRAALTLLPAILKLKDKMMGEYQYTKAIRVGAAGGIGTPEAVAAAFVMGADFVLTGSINQCTVEAGTSDAVKDILEQLDIQDTTTAPAGDMFEIGARMQVVRKGLLFPARANKLYDLYTHYPSLDDIPTSTQEMIQEHYFKRSFAEVWAETRSYLLRENPATLEKAERNPKQKMALIFRWYFIHTTRLALQGNPEQRVDYQIHCGSALGAFNQYVKNTPLAPWRNRHVDDIGRLLMDDACTLLSKFLLL